MATCWENSCSFGLRYVFLVSVPDCCFFSHLGFWSGNLFLIAPFPDLYLYLSKQCLNYFTLFRNCVFDLDFSCKFLKLQYNSLAFVAGLKRANDEGSLSETVQ